MSYLLIFLLNMIYLPAVKYGLISDDATHMKLFPYKVKAKKLISILVHITVAEYIYIAFGADLGSLLAALLFSVHPVTIQVTCFMAGRNYGFNALIFLLALAFAPYSSFVYFFSILGIGTTVLTPLVFVTTRFPYLALLSIPLIILSRKKMSDTVSAKKEKMMFGPDLPDDFVLYKFEKRKIILAVKTFGFYVLKSLLPVKNGFFDSFMTTLGASDKETRFWYSFNRHFWGGILAIVTMFIIWCFNIHNFIGMGIMLFVLPIIPFLNFITVQQFTAPRYAYLPLIGIQIALVGLLIQLGVIGYCVISGLFVFYLDRMIKVKRLYKKNDTDMIFMDSQEFPDNPRLWYYRYEYMLHKNNPVMAFAEASYGLKYLPEDCQLWFGLACASFELNDMNATLDFLKNSEKFMILAERRNMQELIDELRIRVKDKLAIKFGSNNKRRF